MISPVTFDLQSLGDGMPSAGNGYCRHFNWEGVVFVLGLGSVSEGGDSYRDQVVGISDQGGGKRPCSPRGSLSLGGSGTNTEEEEAGGGEVEDEGCRLGMVGQCG